MIVRTTRAAARGATRAGFTLMEVLVVVAILVVLAGTGGVIYMNYLESAKEDVARTQVQALTEAAQMYQIKYGSYPANLASLTQPMPDGRPATLEPSALLDPWQREYQYQYPGAHHQGTNKPDVWSTGPDGNTQIGNWSATGR
jgi:general secretion pathway protein G